MHEIEGNGNKKPLTVARGKRLFFDIATLPAMTADRESFDLSHVCKATIALPEGEDIDQSAGLCNSVHNCLGKEIKNDVCSPLLPSPARLQGGDGETE
ncbi:hypothetical protein [uncultured Gimesia sp.]|uniref:hypothetical protein n=1 Tax=uncultured Gimesia sp. TaxID=1678688 RepID=UPI00261CB2A1|nr:hypothetical protein [uncultured Gimesia sp.]